MSIHISRPLWHLCSVQNIWAGTEVDPASSYVGSKSTPKSSAVRRLFFLWKELGLLSLSPHKVKAPKKESKGTLGVVG